VIALWLLACGTSLEATGPGGMVGVLRAADGTPVVGQRVSTLETDDETDETGRFEVIWQPPNQHVSIRRTGLVIGRTYRPGEDDGRVLELTLPTMRSTVLACPPTPCDVVATWPLPDHYEATLRLRCKEPLSTHTLIEVPASEPQVRCTTGKGKAEKEVPVAVIDQGGTITLAPPVPPVRVEVRAVSGELPDDCVVHVGGAAATATDGGWEAQTRGPSTVRAVCGGRPARPQTVNGDAPPPSVALEWSPTGPDLDLPEAFDGTLQLVAEAGEGAGWSLPVQPDAQGVYALPPLGAGSYRVLLVAEGEQAALLAEPPPPVDDTLVLAPTAGASQVGRLVLTRDLDSGRVHVKRTQP
jgi:hypothetical protein